MPTSEPRFWRNLKRVGKLPVPWIVKYANGKILFGFRNLHRMRDCFHKRLCAVCGEKIVGPLTFAGGVLATSAGIFNEPNMHEECLRASLDVCPYLKSKVDPLYATTASGCKMTEKDNSIGYHAQNILRVQQLIEGV